MESEENGREKPAALALLASHRPRNVTWIQSAGLLYGDWGTSRLYVLGLAFFFASRTSFWLILMMSLLILAVGWAFTQICRIYPDGGGVYTAAKGTSKMLAVVGALMLFADYTVTASLSALDAFHYFGMEHHDELLSLHSPGLWAIVAIAVIGAFNLMGPKHTGMFAIVAAVGMMAITLLITLGALPQISWSELPQQIGGIDEPFSVLWVQFVSIVLALSGVEAIANLTGVMKRPVSQTASRAIWVVAIEVAVFNVLLAICMVGYRQLTDQNAHKEDMLAFLSGAYLGHWAELCVRMLGGILLLSAANTALTDMISVQYLMARDGELPHFMVGLNKFGVPTIPAIVAAGVPICVLLFTHTLEDLAALYAIGVVGAVAISVLLVAFHPRLHRKRRKLPMLLLAFLLLAIWVTVAYTRPGALRFVLVVMAIGLAARALTQWWTKRQGEKPSLLRQAIAEQLTSDALARPKMLVGTYGSEALAPAAFQEAANSGATLVVCFVREVQLSYKYDGEQQLTLDTDQAAQKTFSRFLELGHEAGVPIIPVYDTGSDAAVLMAEQAAMHGCEKILIGTTRKGAVYHLIKGHFQRRLESLLPPEIHVQVVSTEVSAVEKN